MPRILIVEGDDANRDLLSRRLVRQGFEIAVASDGERAVECARMESPDLIVMDMNLAVIDGWEATRRLKDDAGTQSIPIIALAAQGTAADRARAIEAGCEDFDTKPVVLARLMAKIYQALGLPDSRKTPLKPPRGDG